VAQEQEQLQLGQQERDRLKVLHEVERGQLRQWEAAERLGLSERGFRKLLSRYRTEGDRAVVHGLRGCSSNRQFPERLKKQALRIVQREYRDFGPTLAAEYLQADHGLEVSRETLRKWLLEAGLWRAKARRLERVHVWRARRSSRGELVQWDTSVHAWLEERGPQRMLLVGLIDDATNELFARFVMADNTEEHLRVFRQYVERHGRPQAVYTDKASLFEPTLAPGWKQDEARPKAETQIGRALRELRIERIAAQSPQAKGRIERCFGTLQDRLVKALRKAKIKTLDEANQFLQHSFLPFWNQRFTVPPASAVDAHRAVSPDTNLDSVFSLAETRTVARDYTIFWHGQRWQIPACAVRPGLRQSRIRIEQRLDGTMVAQLANQVVTLAECRRRTESPVELAKPGKRFVPAPGQSRWMDHFPLQGNATWKARRDQQAAALAQLRSPSGLPPSG
jgi:transposase